ncbi:MAG TPA: Rid family detoxifying hydrolase [Candidatus Angelobacter sp.]|nr:Rid family detoxifying hydrolase [Candidatus Angelobacter sp.]
MQHLDSAGAPLAGGPYSHAVIAAGLVFLSGQRPVDPETGQLVEGISDQTRQVLTNIATVLESSGCTMADVVKVTAHLADIGDFDAFNEVYRQFFQAPFPARTTVGSTLRGILVEVDVVAELPRTRTTGTAGFEH